MSREQEVDGLAVPVEVLPVTFDFDVCFVHSPTRADRALWSFAESRF